MLNQLVLMGRLVANPIVREINQDAIKSFTTFTLAFDNIAKDESSFIDCVAFNNTGTALAKYSKKGDKIAVVGAIRQRKYVAKDGTNRSVIEVVVDSIEFLQPKKDEASVPNPDEFLTDGKPVKDAVAPKKTAPKKK